MSQSLSEDEFHRMQLQIIEMRTENYQLKDESKKQILKIKDLTEKEAKLDKELNKQIKLKKALSTLNRSKQAQEYEALMQQQEQEFALQGQTLMQELSKLTISIEKLEKENQQLKREGNVTTIDSSDADLRRLQAENTALKRSIENIQVHHTEELKQQKDCLKESTIVDHVNPVPESSDILLNNQENASSPQENNANSNSVDMMDDSSQKSDHPTPTVNHSINVEAYSAMEQKLLHAEAQCERLTQKLNRFQDMDVQYETEKEEKKLLQAKLEEERNHHMKEHRALINEVEAFREKLDRKQTLFMEIQEEKEKLILQNQSMENTLGLQRQEITQKADADCEKLKNENISLGNALQSAHNLLEKQQANLDGVQTQLQSQGEEKLKLTGEIDQLKACIGEMEQKLQIQMNTTSEYLSQIRTLEGDAVLLKTNLDKTAIERHDTDAKLEEKSRANNDLLVKLDLVEKTIESLRKELHEAEELAAKRKKVMDEQAIETQENNAKSTARIGQLQSEYEATMERINTDKDEKIKTLERTCKRQEQELVRMNLQDQTKSRELDSCQQQLRDLQASTLSLENSKGWFERALKDAEILAEEKKTEHSQLMEDLNKEHQKELEKVRLQLLSKDDEVSAAEQRVEEAKLETSKRDDIVKKLERDINDEVSKQRLVEKKGQATLKDLKRQLVNERKRNEKLQEKLGEISSSKSNLDELLQVVDSRTSTTGGDGSSASSFSFRDLISTSKHVPTDTNSQTASSNTSFTTAVVSRAESEDLLSRVTVLQQDKWRLEEQVRHLEGSAGAMANELLEKSKLLQEYVQRTRSDVHRVRASNEELGSSRTLGNRMKSMITGQEEADVVNLRELNKKLTRMLEEEMTKNMSLKQDLETLTDQISAKR